MREQRKLQVGDTIKCRDVDDMIETMTELAQEGVETDFQDNKQFILIVTRVEA